MIKIKRALVSVYDKTGLEELAKKLLEYQVDFVATQSTCHFLKQKGIPCTLLSTETGYPELIHGRVKTLHPKIFGGILARNKHGEMEEINAYEIPKIDLVVVNLYPFIECAQKTDDPEALTDEIDIGGVALLRAAAKNYFDTVALPSPSYYQEFIDQLELYQGAIMPELVKKLMKKTFYMTSAYDWAIFQKFSLLDGEEWNNQPWKKHSQLRYGENPHQKASYWISCSEVNSSDESIMGCKVLHGKTLSYNNLLDISAGLKLLDEFNEPSCVIVKHANPCGVSSADSIEKAYYQAFEADSVSAFGGVFLFNETISLALAMELSKLFIEIIIAPSFEQAALEVLQQKKNIRLLQRLKKAKPTIDQRSLYEGLLQQEQNTSIYHELKTVAGKEPNEKECSDIIFGIKVVKHMNSNAIVLVKNKSTLGMGMGQANRVQSTRLALQQAQEKTKGSILISDGFLPFADSVEEAAKHQISILVEPGGSIKDQEVIASAKENGITLVFTGMRHFKH